MQESFNRVADKNIISAKFPDKIQIFKNLDLMGKIWIYTDQHAIQNKEVKYMKIVTINIPDQYLDCLETMVNMGFFPSRSEAVRQALKRFLTIEQEMNKDLAPERFQALKVKQVEAMMQYKEIFFFTSIF